MEKEAAIILAAGEGKRMESKDSNKVTRPLGGKPMIVHTVELLDSLNISPIIIVVGFAGDSVRSAVGRDDIVFVEQKERLGTAHAVKVALEEVSQDVSDVLILQGDDSAFYKKQTIEQLISEHHQREAALTFLTIEVNNPTGLGRVLRNSEGHLLGIVEEKDATEKERSINEINPACYIASAEFLRKYIDKVEKSPVTGEYYLTHLVDIALKNHERVVTLRAGKLPWRGVNTPDELLEAQKLFDEVSS